MEKTESYPLHGKKGREIIRNYPCLLIFSDCILGSSRKNREMCDCGLAVAMPVQTSGRRCHAGRIAQRKALTATLWGVCSRPCMAHTHEQGRNQAPCLGKNQRKMDFFPNDLGKKNHFCDFWVKVVLRETVPRYIHRLFFYCLQYIAPHVYRPCKA